MRKILKEILAVCIVCLLVASANAYAVTWVAPTERTDNTKIDPSELKGFDIHCGTSTGNYSSVFNVPDGLATNFTLTFASSGFRYCAMKAYDTENRYSGFSNEVSKDFQASIPVSNEPNVLVAFNATQIDGLRYRFTYKLPTEFVDGRKIQQGDIRKLYLFEIFADNPSGKWVRDINPPLEAFEMNLTEGEHFFNMEVEVSIDGKHEVSKRSLLVAVDVKLVNDISPPMAPTSIQFGDNDGLQ